MQTYRETTHLSEILEESQKNPVIIFIFSSDCGTSTELSTEIMKGIKDKIITQPIFRVTVQSQPVLSQKIEDWFQIQHESPQIIILNNGKVTYTEHHKAIKIKNFRFK